MEKSKTIYLLSMIILLSLTISYIFGEDSLGGAKHDYLFHEKFVKLFSEDFTDTIKSYGTRELQARNSPILYILLGLLLKIGLPFYLIKYFNGLVIILLLHSFYICLKEKYPKIGFTTYLIFQSVILLSPTVRSLLIWPYPLIWALVFFLYSVYYYLKFSNSNNLNKKFIFSLKNLFFVALSAYFTPNFAVFALYFFFKYFITFKITNKLLIIIFINFLLATPALLYYHLTDYYLLNNNYPFPNLNLNISNKIIIISSLIFFYFIPFIKLNAIKFDLKEIKFNLKTFIISLFIVLNIFFFNFINNAGGGIFFHLSNLIFNNSIVVFLVFILFINLMNNSEYINLNNIVLYFILIIYNIQYTIYHKYFDPLLLIIFLFLFDFKENKSNLNLSKISKKYLILYCSFLIISLGKNYINY